MYGHAFGRNLVKDVLNIYIFAHLLLVDDIVSAWHNFYFWVKATLLFAPSMLLRIYRNDFQVLG